MDVRVLTKEGIIENYQISHRMLINSKADVDDIDHLSNRRVRTVGEQLSNQFDHRSGTYVAYYPRAYERP